MVQNTRQIPKADVPECDQQNVRVYATDNAGGNRDK